MNAPDPGLTLRRQLRTAESAINAASGLSAGALTDSDIQAARGLLSQLSRLCCFVEQRLGQVASARSGGNAAAGAARDA